MIINSYSNFTIELTNSRSNILRKMAILYTNSNHYYQIVHVCISVLLCHSTLIHSTYPPKDFLLLNIYAQTLSLSHTHTHIYSNGHDSLKQFDDSVTELFH